MLEIFLGFENQIFQKIHFDQTSFKSRKWHFEAFGYHRLGLRLS